MKTGKIARALGIDRKTVTNWTEMPQFRPLFTQQALGIDRTQRDYQESDMLIINTIRVMRNRNAPWDEIAEVLNEGERERELPVTAMLVETTAPIAQYGKIVELQTTLESTQEELAELQEQLKEAQDQLTASSKLHQVDIERVLREAAEREGKLHREIGKLEAQVAMLKGQKHS